MFMRALKDVVSMNKAIQCSSNTHKILMNDLEVLEGRMKDVE